MLGLISSMPKTLGHKYTVKRPCLILLTKVQISLGPGLILNGHIQQPHVAIKKFCGCWKCLCRITPGPRIFALMWAGCGDFFLQCKALSYLRRTSCDSLYSHARRLNWIHAHCTMQSPCVHTIFLCTYSTDAVGYFSSIPSCTHGFPNKISYQ